MQYLIIKFLFYDIEEIILNVQNCINTVHVICIKAIDKVYIDGPFVLLIRRSIDNLLAETLQFFVIRKFPGPIVLQTFEYTLLLFVLFKRRESRYSLFRRTLFTYETRTYK